MKLRFAARRVNICEPPFGDSEQGEECPPWRAYKSRENLHSDTDVNVFVAKLLLNYNNMLKKTFEQCFFNYREGLSSTKNCKKLLFGQKANKFFLYNRNFIAVQISTRLISSPLRASFGGSQLSLLYKNSNE